MCHHARPRMDIFNVQNMFRNQQVDNQTLPCTALQANLLESGARPGVKRIHNVMKCGGKEEPSGVTEDG